MQLVWQKRLPDERTDIKTSHEYVMSMSSASAVNVRPYDRDRQTDGQTQTHNNNGLKTAA